MIDAAATTNPAPKIARNTSDIHSVETERSPRARNPR